MCVLIRGVVDLFTAFCLRDLKIFVPDAVVAGTAARLSCQYDLEQVSWH